MIIKKPKQEGNRVYRVRVFDSAKTRHGRDTRKKNENGVGTGTMWFEVDKDYAPVAYYWSNPNWKSVKQSIAIGPPVR